MSRIKTWLVSDKKFLNYFRALSRNFPNRYRSYLFVPDVSTVNYSTYLSHSFQQNKFIKGEASFAPTKTPTASRVPPTGGTLSFRGQFSSDVELKHIWLLEIEKIASRHREGIIKILERHRPQIFFYPIFNPRSFSYDLAGKSDYYFIKKRSWQPIGKQLESIFTRINSRRDLNPKFPRKFTLKEKLLMRFFWKFRQQFVGLEDISSYVYGKRLAKNIHASEALLWEIRKKLRKLVGRNGVIKNFRNCGFKIEDDVWENIFADQEITRKE